MGGQAIGSGPVGPVAPRQRRGDLGRDQRRIGQPLQPYEHSAIRIFTLLATREFHQQPGLPDPAGPRQREQPQIGIGQQSRKLGQLALAPDQPRDRLRQPRRRGRSGGVRDGPCGGSAREQRRIVIEDPLLELRGRLTWLQTELAQRPLAPQERCRRHRHARRRRGCRSCRDAGRRGCRSCRDQVKRWSARSASMRSMTASSRSPSHRRIPTCR